MEKTSNAPVYRQKLGRVQAAVFARPSQDGSRTLYSSELSVRYRDEKSGEYRSTSSFRADDLACVVVLAQRCLNWILARQKDENAES